MSANLHCGKKTFVHNQVVKISILDILLQMILMVWCRTAVCPVSYLWRYCSLALTNLPLDKMAAISQTIFADAFSWMKICSLIEISLNQCWPDSRTHICSSRGDELSYQCSKRMLECMLWVRHFVVFISLIIPCFNKVERRYTGFTLSICGKNCVRSVSSTILISYLHMLSSNFRRCVVCKVCFKI